MNKIRSKRHLKFIAAAVCMMTLAAGALGCSDPDAVKTAQTNNGAADSSGKGDGAGDTADGQKILTVGTSYTVSTFIPWKSTTDGDRYILSNIYESLIEYDTMGNFLPGLAESWENEDDLTWIFHLRDNSYWQTGNDLFKDEKVRVTAKDIKSVFDWMMDDANDAVRCSSIKSVIDHIEAVDDTTLKFVTKKPEALLLSSLSNIYIFPMKAVEENFDLGKTPVGSGPYKFVKYNTDDQTVLEKNDDYYIQPGLDKVVFKIIPDKAVGAIALENHEIDIAVSLLSTDLDAVAAQADLKLLPNPLGWYRYMGFNEDDPLFADKDMRKAICMAVDVDSAVKAIFQNKAGLKLGVRAYGPIPLEMPGADEAAWKKAGVSYDPQGAKSLIEAMGYTMGKNGYYEKDGKELGFTLKTVNTDPNMKFGVIISTELKKIGINCVSQPMEFATLTSDIKSSNVQAFVMGGGSTLDGLNMMFHSEKSKGTSHRTNYVNHQLDAKLDEAFQTMDETKRAKLLTEASCMAIEDCVHLDGYFEYVQLGMNQRVKNFDTLPTLWPSLTNSTRNVTVE